MGLLVVFGLPDVPPVLVDRETDHVAAVLYQQSNQVCHVIGLTHWDMAAKLRFQQVDTGVYEVPNHGLFRDAGYSQAIGLDHTVARFGAYIGVWVLFVIACEVGLNKLTGKKERDPTVPLPLE